MAQKNQFIDNKYLNCNIVSISTLHKYIIWIMSTSFKIFGREYTIFKKNIATKFDNYYLSHTDHT